MSLERTIRDATEYLEPGTVDCVVYHSPCNDGSGAALGAWVRLGSKAIYEKLAYHTPINEELLRGKRVVFVDCSLKREDLRRVRGIAAKVMILDHHASARDDLRGEPGCFFCMDHSGAVLSWYYFNGVDSQCPRLLRLIEDRDLWRWDDRDASEALHYGLVEKHPTYDFKEYEQYLDDRKLDDLIAFGKSLRAEHHEWCMHTAQRAHTRRLRVPGDPQIYTVMCMELEGNKLISELSEYLYSNNEDIDFTMLWFKVGPKYKISFRTNKSEVDLSVISTKFGGGGHPRAAGVSLSQDPWELFE